MGRAAGAVLTAVAPEAKLASKAAGRRPPVPDPRVAAPGSKAAQQREQIEQIKTARPPGPTGLPAHVPTAPAATRPAPASPGAGPSLPQVSIPAPVQTGSGFLLGLTLWGWVVLPYLRGGAKEVRKTFAAKFFNKTSS